MWRMGQTTIEYRKPAKTAQEKKRDVETHLRQQRLIEKYFQLYKIDADDEEDRVFQIKKNRGH